MAKRPEREIAARAEDVLRSLGKWSLPVDPFAIAAEEEIELAPGDYGAGFDGRIRYLPEDELLIVKALLNRKPGHVR